MRRVLGLGMGAALAMQAVNLVISDEPAVRRGKVHPLRDPSPNDFGPVIDTTPESKRARRRRLARAKS